MHPDHTRAACLNLLYANTEHEHHIIDHTSITVHDTKKQPRAARAFVLITLSNLCTCWDDRTGYTAILLHDTGMDQIVRFAAWQIGYEPSQIS